MSQTEQPVEEKEKFVPDINTYVPKSELPTEEEVEASKRSMAPQPPAGLPLYRTDPGE